MEPMVTKVAKISPFEKNFRQISKNQNVFQDILGNFHV